MINRDLIRRKIVQLTYAYYQNSDHNMENAEKELMFSLSKSYDLYNYMLQLIVAITQEARKRYDVDVARAKREGEQEPSPRFAFNKFALQLEENKMLLEWIDVKHSNWDEDIEMVRKVYTAITSSDLYADYVSGAIDEELADLDEYSRDREVWRRIYKQFIQNNEDLDAFLEEKSLYWNDDKDIIDTFVLKTIKRFDPEAKAKQELLPEYKDAEDREFARKLFRATILNCDTYQRYMSEALRNWDFSRLAYMDVIIMQIAIAEVMNFPGIPATVSINEYVDLARHTALLEAAVTLTVCSTASAASSSAATSSRRRCLSVSSMHSTANMPATSALLLSVQPAIVRAFTALRAGESK